VGHPRKLASERIGIHNVLPVESRADVHDRQTTPCGAVNQLARDIDVGIGKPVRLFTDIENSVTAATQLV
jgi:hypothetical protein